MANEDHVNVIDAVDHSVVKGTFPCEVHNSAGWAAKILSVVNKSSCESISEER